MEQRLNIESDIQLLGGRGVAQDPTRKGDWMQTWTGGRFYVGDPRPEEVDILDIINALSMTSRYNGQCRFYSIMEHSIGVSEMVSPQYRRVAFAHDWDEVYLPDLHRPAKRTLGANNPLSALALNIWKKALCPRFNLPEELPQEVKIADSAICIVEQEALHPRSEKWDMPWARPNVLIQCLPPEMARWAGLKRYCELFSVPYQPLAHRMQVLIDQDQLALEAHWHNPDV